MLILSLLIGGLYTFLISGSRTVDRGSEELEAVRTVNRVLERIKRDLRTVCEVFRVNSGSPEVSDDGHRLQVLCFAEQSFTSDGKPPTRRVRYVAEEVTRKVRGKDVRRVLLKVETGRQKGFEILADDLADVRFQKYFLNKKPFYRVALSFDDPTSEGKIHTLVTSVGSRYYAGLIDDPYWLQVPEASAR